MVAISDSEPGDVSFAQVRLPGQGLSLMDSTHDHGFTFSPGVSLELQVDTQTEIDRLGEGLSAVPEACGWLVGKFGVSWQIVPSNLDELMTRRGADERLMTMKRIVIDEL